jgi:hypothetical protein
MLIRIPVRDDPADYRQRDRHGTGTDPIRVFARWRPAMTGLPGGSATYIAVSIVVFVVMGVSACAAGRVDYRCDIPVDFDRISVNPRSGPKR